MPKKIGVNDKNDGRIQIEPKNGYNKKINILFFVFPCFTYNERLKEYVPHFSNTQNMFCSSSVLYYNSLHTPKQKSTRKNMMGKESLSKNFADPNFISDLLDLSRNDENKMMVVSENSTFSCEANISRLGCWISDLAVYPGSRLASFGRLN
jgi:hypothetical protein